jgi:hypothetical protein
MRRKWRRSDIEGARRRKRRRRRSNRKRGMKFLAAALFLDFTHRIEAFSCDSQCLFYYRRGDGEGRFVGGWCAVGFLGITVAVCRCGG